jgi:hypothetical protein
MHTEKDELLIKKEELEKRLAEIRKDMAGGFSADSEERAIEMENTDVLLEIARVTKMDLELIDKKLQQLND